ALVMHLAGTGPLTWRLWDWSLSAVAGISIWKICQPYGNFPALFASSLFLLIHGRDGIIELGQRDLLLTVLILISYALLFTLLRRPNVLLGRGYLAFLGSASLTCAALVKPFALLLFPALALCIFLTRTNVRHLLRRFYPHLKLGVVLPLLATYVFLRRWHADHAFVDVMAHLAPLHAAILRKPLHVLLAHSISSVLRPLFFVWLLLCVMRRSWSNPDLALLLTGVAVGIFSFCLQGRGYPYHRYPSEALLLVVIGIDLSSALEGDKASRWLSYAGLAFAVACLAPGSVRAMRHYDWRSNVLDDAIQAEMTNIGTSHFNRNVQCLDMAGGCITALWRAHILQSSGYLYDCYLFIPVQSESARREQEWYREGFLQAFRQHTPQYLIVTSDECGIVNSDFSYRKLTYWPELDTLIRSNYQLTRQWTPDVKEGWQGKPALPYGFRLYTQTTPAH
ncbi:MAG TPA: hypothetical protein VGD64_13280, partial [Acidisarcina sp.]